MFIFDAGRYAREAATLPKEVEATITEAGGEVLVSRLWEERRLAFPIRNQRKGAYWLIYFRSGSGAITGLNRQYEIHEGILRHLILKVHPQLVEAVLSHASGRAAVPEPATAESV